MSEGSFVCYSRNELRLKQFVTAPTLPQNQAQNLIKLDFLSEQHRIMPMNSEKTLNSALIKQTLRKLGLSQKELAEQTDVTGQAVTNWLKGKDFPRPAALLRLSVSLGLEVDDLVTGQDAATPIVAFRKKGSSKTTQAHIEKATHIGWLLRPLVPFLPLQSQIRPVLRSDPNDPKTVCDAATQTREKLVGNKPVIKYGDLIQEFSRCGAVLIPVMWGEQEKHKNALHIHLPQEDITFIFLNLDTRVEDFKFWMAHELAHVYTPHLAGTEEGEEFADTFASKLLFPVSLAKDAYNKISKLNTQKLKVEALEVVAREHTISLYTVFSQINAYAEDNDLSKLGVSEKSVHQLRNIHVSEKVSEKLFGEKQPTARKYLRECTKKFKTSFFDTLGKKILERDVAAGYLQQVLSVTHAEASELHQVLVDGRTRTS